MSSVLERIQAQKAAAEAAAAEKKAAEEVAVESKASHEAHAERVRSALSLSREKLSGLLSGQVEDRKALSSQNKEGIAAKLSETESLYTETEAAGVELSDTDKQEGRLETIRSASDPKLIESLKAKRDEIRASKQLEKTHSYLQENISNLSAEEITALSAALESGDAAAISTVEGVARNRISSEVAANAEKEATEVAATEKEKREKEAADLEEKIKNFPESHKKLASEIKAYYDAERKRREDINNHDKRDFDDLRSEFSVFVEQDAEAAPDSMFDEMEKASSLYEDLLHEVGTAVEVEGSFAARLGSFAANFEESRRLLEQREILYPGDMITPDKDGHQKSQVADLLKLYPRLTEDKIKKLNDEYEKAAIAASHVEKFYLDKFLADPRRKAIFDRLIGGADARIRTCRDFADAAAENNRIARAINEKEGKVYDERYNERDEKVLYPPKPFSVLTSLGIWNGGALMFQNGRSNRPRNSLKHSNALYTWG